MHTNRITNEILNTIEFNTCFIPTSSPDLAPVELDFAFVKRRFFFKYKNQKINIWNKESILQLLLF